MLAFVGEIPRELGAENVAVYLGLEHERQENGSWVALEGARFRVRPGRTVGTRVRHKSRCNYKSLLA